MSPRISARLRPIGCASLRTASPTRAGSVSSSAAAAAASASTCSRARVRRLSRAAPSARCPTRSCARSTTLSSMSGNGTVGIG